MGPAIHGTCGWRGSWDPSGGKVCVSVCTVVLPASRPQDPCPLPRTTVPHKKQLSTGSELSPGAPDTTLVHYQGGSFLWAGGDGIWAQVHIMLGVVILLPQPMVTSLVPGCINKKAMVRCPWRRPQTQTQLPLGPLLGAHSASKSKLAIPLSSSVTW